MNNEITGAEIVLKSLTEQGVEVVFGYPGGAVLPIYDTLFKQNSIKHVLVRQEGGAIHAAEGYARSCLLYTSPSPRDATTSRMPSSA